MPTIKCPSCRRILNLPDGLRGTEVQCPGCRTNFVPPRPDEPLTPIPLAQPVPQTPAPQSADPSETFDFNDEQESRYYRIRRKVEAPARWLRRAVLFDFLPTFVCCPIVVVTFKFLGDRFDDRELRFLAMNASDFWVTGIFVVVGSILLPSILLLIGAHSLDRRKHYGLVMTSAIVAFVVALKNLVVLLYLVPALLLNILGVDMCSGFLTLAVIALATAATVNAIVGGVQTLTVLNDPEVHLSFR